MKQVAACVHRSTLWSAVVKFVTPAQTCWKYYIRDVPYEFMFIGTYVCTYICSCIGVVGHIVRI